MVRVQDNYSQHVKSAKNFNCFDPLLVELHDSVRAYRKDKNDVNKHRELINSVMALLDADLSHHERILTADVLIGLIKQAEINIRKNLALKLAIRDDLPISLLNYMVYENIDLAEPVLLNSKQLSDIDLIYIINAKDVEHWQVIAQRNALSSRVVEELVKRNNPQTFENLLDNQTICLDYGILKKISALTDVCPTIADRLVHYEGLPKQMAVEIYWRVSTALRQEISNLFDINDIEIDKALEDCVQDFTDTVLQSDNMEPSHLMVDIAAHYAERGNITGSLLVATLQRRQGRFFIALFSKLTGLNFEVIIKTLEQISGQALAVASLAKSISKEDFISIFLLSRTIVRSKKPIAAQDLNMAIRYYDSLTFKMANEILNGSLSNEFMR